MSSQECPFDHFLIISLDFVALGDVSVTFSSTMRPDQLAQWLLQEYGDAYQEDIDKLESI